MAGALTACAFYFIQDHKNGKIIWFNVYGYKNKIQRFFARKQSLVEEDEEVHAQSLVDEDEEVHAQMLLSIPEAMTAFIVGMEKIFGALVVLILAWASGAVMVSVGLSEFTFVPNFILISYQRMSADYSAFHMQIASLGILSQATHLTITYCLHLHSLFLL